MATKKGEITPKQNKALMVLAVGQSNDAAAKIAGVTTRTIANWMKEEPFHEELRRAMERMRQMFEGRVMSLANNGAVIIQEAMQHPNFEYRMDGAKTALGAGVKLASRYKELRAEGFVPPTAPLVIFPEGSVPCWANTKALPQTIDVEAEVVPDDDSDPDS
jgi:transposase